MKKILAFSALLLIALAAFRLPAYAQNDDPPSVQIQKRDQDQVQDPSGPATRNQNSNVLSESDNEQGNQPSDPGKQGQSEAACTQLQARINNRLRTYESNKEKYHNRYYGIQKKVTDLADKLEAKGCDITPIRTDLATFEDHLNDFAATFRVFVNHMQTTRSQACDSTDTDFRQSARQASNQVQTMQQAARKLHDFVTGTLKLHLKSVTQNCQNLPTQVPVEE